MKKHKRKENEVKNSLQSIGSDLHYQYLLKYAVQKINDLELAKDLVQDTFLTAMESIGQFEQRSSELTWLTAILKYKIFRVYRKKEEWQKMADVQGDIEYPAVNLADHLPDESDRQLDKMVKREFEEAAARFIKTLPLKCQQLYLLKFIYNEKTSVICKKLELTPQNYWIRSHRLKAALKKWYMEKWAGD